MSFRGESSLCSYYPQNLHLGNFFTRITDKACGQLFFCFLRCAQKLHVSRQRASGAFRHLLDSSALGLSDAQLRGGTAEASHAVESQHSDCCPNFTHGEASKMRPGEIGEISQGHNLGHL